MQLTKKEFSQFNLKSKMQMVREYGTLLFTKRLNETYELQLFLVFNFFVEIFHHSRENRAISIEPLMNEKWMRIYFTGNDRKDFKKEEFSLN